MRYILIILVFLSVGANAQMVIKAHANYRPYAVAAQNLLLDDYPNAAAAYSLRKLDKDYTGNCMRIRRSSDNAESDIGFVNNYLDTTAIKNFCGSGAGAAVVTWFDQSGNGRDANQSTAANQPAIMSFNFEFGTIDAIASSEKAIVFNQSGYRLINNFSTISQPISVFTYARKDNVTTALAGTIYDSYNNTASILFYTGITEATNNRWALGQSGALLQGTTSGTTNPSIFSTLHNSTSSSIHINGQSYVSGNAGTNGLNGLSIGNLRGNPSPIAGGYVLNGRIAEMIIYGSNQSSNRTGIENNINDYYNIYWNGDFAGLLDSFPSSAAAYSLRNLSSTYTGPLIRVRRSNDNAEQDIYGDYYGNLDTVGLKNFVGANNGFVVTWYDQSGNGRNATQGTASRQPSIIGSGVILRNPVNNKILIQFNYSQSNSLVTSNQTFTGDVTMFGTYNMFQVPNLTTEFSYGIFNYGEEANAKRRSIIIWNGGSGSTWYHYASGFAQNVQIAQATAPTNSLVYSLFNHTSQQISGGYNGGTAVTASRTLTNPVASPIRIGATGSEFSNSNIYEFIFYNSNQSSNRTGIENNINTYYGIY